jgi:formate hydrogenlyase subunit 3/multisubunit Na+/H+ antiporter MnhD subunit
MSAVMLKTAVYGVLRVTFDLLGKPQWWWGLVLLALGLFSALYGVVFAAVQTDMKRLLAWSSIENLGIIFTGIGLAVVFHGVGMNSLAALALIAALYHSLNHAFMKSLLFLGTGAVLHSTGERNLGRLGGLIHRMPWVAWLTLVGALAMAGLPPLNGFVSEWLLLQAFLFSHEVPRSFVNMMLPVGAALVALSAALAAYVMVKFFGVIFLGQPREPALNRAQDAGILERIGLIWLALGCFVLGLLPTYIIGALRTVVAQLSGASLPSGNAPWWLLMPVPGGRASYSATVFCIARRISSAILGMPPFGVFASEFLILTTAMREQPWATPILLIALGVAFAAIFGRVQPMVFGETTAKRLQHPPALLPMFAHLAIVLMLGIYVPPYLADWYRAAARLIGGQ